MMKKGRTMHFAAVVEEFKKSNAAGKEAQQWVMATLVGVEGHSYRKAGAFMLVNSIGQSFGILSGGCLEADIIRQAKKVFINEKPIVASYDFTEESEEAWQLGLGCGGKLTILLVEVNEDIEEILKQLEERLNADESNFLNVAYRCDAKGIVLETEINLGHEGTDVRKDDWHSVSKRVDPQPRLLVIGSGADVVPVVDIAYSLGWNIVVVDEAVSEFKRQQFKRAEHYLNITSDDLGQFIQSHSISASVVMTHNVSKDARYLNVLCQSTQSYIGLLGPIYRRNQVLEKSGLEYESIKHRLSSPVGLDIGGELPGSIALSILAECHQFIFSQRRTDTLAK